jgi:hypothetical protein
LAEGNTSRRVFSILLLAANEKWRFDLGGLTVAGFILTFDKAVKKACRVGLAVYKAFQFNGA